MKNVMIYKGYLARIEFDPRDNIFIGKILGIADSITFQGETVKELKADFRAPRSILTWKTARSPVAPR